MAGDGNELERFSHRRIDVDEVYEVVYGGAEPKSHRCLMNDLRSAVPDHRYPKHYARVAIGDHLDDASLIADGPSPRNKLHRHRCAPAAMPPRYGLFLSKSNYPHLRI